MWPWDDFDYGEVDAREGAGGLMTIWNTSFLAVTSFCGGQRFLFIEGLAGSFFSCTIGNVCAPNDVGQRRELWRNISMLRVALRNPWCLGGDFNELLKLGEHRGCTRRDRGM
ncbi:hypothetical protein Dimus_039221 [Dionaea muscipula]